ncbi:uncharacterized protein LOC124435577 isoform X2 [Xenia sp. Carnegie-2017]|uniref:uncharacterized protein LOC124435577 isoform X2 n=1 Tax=Xenia sp. Carnegie-2017 TaxID=2897299 RepID=UPI001F04BD8B|nr:uncharacterized protein LOC124435577 isoform X2 [Xenia sp. Carnegie-2017]
MEINKQSSVADIILFLKKNKLDEIVEDFEANQVDGEDFFNLESHDIYQMIPRIKLRKKFTCIWNDVTQKGSSASTRHSYVTSNNIRTINKDVNPDIPSNSADHQENRDEKLE